MLMQVDYHVRYADSDLDIYVVIAKRLHDS